MREQRNIVYTDYSLDADVSPNGRLILLQGKEAVENALKIWLSSFPNDIIRKPHKGGYITRWLLKPMNEETQQEIYEGIIEGLYEDFYPALRVKRVAVLPVYERQEWNITIMGYIPDLKLDINIEETMRSLS